VRRRKAIVCAHRPGDVEPGETRVLHIARAHRLRVYERDAASGNDLEDSDIGLTTRLHEHSALFRAHDAHFHRRYARRLDALRAWSRRRTLNDVRRSTGGGAEDRDGEEQTEESHEGRPVGGEADTKTPKPLTWHGPGQ